LHYIVFVFFYYDPESFLSLVLYQLFLRVDFADVAVLFEQT